jgi:hypothetical protein
MDIEIGRDIALDLIEEFAELLGAMAGHALCDDGPGFDVERGKQRCRTVPLVIMSAPFDLPGPHGQERLCAVESLYFALLIDTPLAQ